MQLTITERLRIKLNYYYYSARWQVIKRLQAIINTLTNINP